MARLIPIVLILFWGLLGCSKVSSSELAGTWVVDEVSRRRLPVELQKASARIVLDENGAFTASDLPGLFYIPPGPAQLESGRGVWKLVSEKDQQQIQLNFHEILNREEINFPYGTHLNVSRAWFAITLFYSLGDPDEGRRVNFEKTNSGRNSF
jgi:hypothetical protein